MSHPRERVPAGGSRGARDGAARRARGEEARARRLPREDGRARRGAAQLEERREGRRAGVDRPAVQKRLLKDGTAACAELGFEGPQGEYIVVLENTPLVHNAIVCTQCSCTAWPVLGLPPDWYKSPEYRSRVVREPRPLLREMGLDVPDGVEIRVWDTTAETRYMVLPVRPQGTEAGARSGSRDRHARSDDRRREARGRLSLTPAAGRATSARRAGRGSRRTSARSRGTSRAGTARPPRTRCPVATPKSAIVSPFAEQPALPAQVRVQHRRERVEELLGRARSPRGPDRRCPRASSPRARTRTACRRASSAPTPSGSQRETSACPRMSLGHSPLSGFFAARYCRIAFDSQSTKSPSSSTGMRLFGFSAAYAGAAARP